MKKEFFSGNNLLGQFARYFVTGGLAFVADFGLFSLCLYAFELHYLIANLVGLVVGLVLNYCVSVVWVFSGCKRNMGNRKGVEFLVFSLIGIGGVGLNQVVMYILVDKFEILELLSKITATSMVLVWNFAARKLILFRGQKE